MKEAKKIDKVAWVCYYSKMKVEEYKLQGERYFFKYLNINDESGQRDWESLMTQNEDCILLVVDADRISSDAVGKLLKEFDKKEAKDGVSYLKGTKKDLIGGFIQKTLGRIDKSILASPLFIGYLSNFKKAYINDDLSQNPLVDIGYSLQKNHVRLQQLDSQAVKFETETTYSKWQLFINYNFKIPFRYLISGDFFRQLFQPGEKVRRDMVYRMLVYVFAVFTFIYMPYISTDYGVTGDEFPDHRHSGYVLDYLSKGDTTAIYQPKTTLHLYGISMQVVAGAICKWFNVDNYYEVRHVVCSLNGALGILFTGLLGLRWGGGICGLLSILLMFLTPRFFGHSMNNLKDIPFATGYVLSVYYTIRLFDYYPIFRLREIIGLAVGIGLALGTRSGGLILYPMLFMYAGFYYISHYGVKEFYKFGKYAKNIGQILLALLMAGIIGYVLAIALWPFALEKPFTNVLSSLEQFTNYSIGLRTIFEGKQMMSNMLPWHYAPKYLAIGMPLLAVVGFIGYLIYVLFKRKEFTLISYFLLFSTIFPVFWVIYKNSNLYGGIRHMLFVMPTMVVIAARFWTEIGDLLKPKLRWIVALIVIGLLSLPLIHMVKNHPNEYVYFNEIQGGLKGAYGNFETDYYFNSLKKSCEWFKENVELPKDKKTIVVTQLSGAVSYYFRKDTNIIVIYSRYYEKYAKDWDYGIFANVYISPKQLREGTFPPKEMLYSSSVDGFPMSVVTKRLSKDDFKGVELEKKGDFQGALNLFEAHVAKYPDSEEVWSRMSRLYYSLGNYPRSVACVQKALALQPSLNEALYINTLNLIQQKNYQGAKGAAQRILIENESSVDGWYLMALSYFYLQEYQQAITALNNVLSFRVDHVQALQLAGNILMLKKDYKNALNVYNRLIAIQRTAQTLSELANCYCRMGRYQEVEQLFAEVEQMQAGFLPIYKVQLRMRLQQRDLNDALSLLNSMNNIHNDTEIFVLRAIYLEVIHKKEEALSMLDAALKIDPDNLEAKEMKMRYVKNSR